MMLKFIISSKGGFYSIYSTDFNDSTIGIFFNLKYITKFTKSPNPRVSKIEYI